MHALHLILTCVLAVAAMGSAQPSTIYTLAGRPTAGTADGFRHKAQFYCPAGVAVDQAGNLYVADTGNCAIRKIDLEGNVTTLAGQFGVSGSSDGFGTNAQFSFPQGIIFNSFSGNLYVADTANHTIRKVWSSGVVTTFAGASGEPNSFDGSASSSRFNHPEGIATDASGNLYIADTWNHTIRKITPAGQVTTFAGLAGNSGAADGPGPKARFNRPSSVAIDPAGNVYVADLMNHTIRKITPAGVVSTIAGAAGIWGNADGEGSASRFYHPQGVATAGTNELVVLDSGNHTLRRISISGSTVTVQTAAGSQGSAAPYDGTGTGARFFFPAGIAAGSDSKVHVADSGNNSLRTERVAPPWLEPSVSSGQLTLRWPVSFINFDLETASALAPGSWNLVQLPVATQGDNFVVITNVGEIRAFYRLHQR